MRHYNGSPSFNCCFVGRGIRPRPTTRRGNHDCRLWKTHRAAPRGKPRAIPGNKRRAARLFAGAALIVIGGCGGQPARQPIDVPPVDDAGSSQPLAARPTPELESNDLAAQMRADAPLRYVVKPGDTLWDIAGYYLRDPWYWPQLWDDNPDIDNPHLIYPGEVLVLTRSANGPRLRHGGTEKRSPRIREQPLDNIAAIPLDAIRAFIEGPRLVDAEALNNAPYAVSFIEQHLVAGQGTTVYVRGIENRGDTPENYRMVRDDGPYVDPATGDVLGRKAIPVGDVRVESFGDDVTTARITSSTREALVGDRLLPVEQQALVRNFYPHAAAEPIEGRVISVFDALFTVGRYQVVTVSAGRNRGVERGHVFDIYSAGPEVSDPVEGGQVALPEVKVGELMVFETESRVSFGLIMRAQRPVHVDDVVRSPTG